nr:MAG TPA: hypothetical protein [Caudoviricetes sp.]
MLDIATLFCNFFKNIFCIKNNPVSSSYGA